MQQNIISLLKTIYKDVKSRVFVSENSQVDLKSEQECDRDLPSLIYLLIIDWVTKTTITTIGNVTQSRLMIWTLLTLPSYNTHIRFKITPHMFDERSQQLGLKIQRERHGKWEEIKQRIMWFLMMKPHFKRWNPIQGCSQSSGTYFVPGKQKYVA